MLANAFATVLAASALLTSAAPVSRDVLEAKDVGVLTCTTFFTGPLQYNVGGDYGYLSFTGPKNEDGLPILHSTRANGDKVPAHDFTMKNCTSNKAKSFTGSIQGGEVARGHIELTSSPGKCITRSTIPGKKHSEFVLDDCSYSDDSSQLFQSFALGPKGYGEYLGHEDSNSPYWQVSLSSQKYKDVLAKIVDTNNIINNLNFYFPTYVPGSKVKTRDVEASEVEAREVDSEDVEARDVEERDVGVLTCTTHFAGYLQYNLNGLYANISFTGPKTEDGLPILHTARANGDEVPGHDFTFKTCVSNKAQSFMGPAPAGSSGPGHFELSSTPGKCITRHAMEGKKHSNFVLEDCSYSDDSSQLLQSFALSAKGYAEFLGYRSGEKQDWRLTVSSQEYKDILAEHVVTNNIVGNIDLYFPDYYTPSGTKGKRDLEA
ncbi:hypothetical protein BCV69DRAFT_155687 [Microstroma glucosiphilum]|uniref:Uncharacterized protein n=1 Tax=Pseudomicrostroma glucosiphilum TaxID=1684307 RepID=A0A316U9A1_9BASI|nr:hypothetical protein BCV69DRAFT_155687 [Pseudomicrostroma glucosiphilum]PWN21796.1 hypothetical protein BCV69DRAFT_155687 [Pseudomicrostroma glucosiphilum]